MSRVIRILLWIVVIILTGLMFVVLLPSLLGIVMTMLLIFGVSDFIVRRRRGTIDAFNSVLKTVVSSGGDLTSVAVAFSQSGPISSQAYEFARRLMMGQEPLEAAARARIPLQLSTAVAMHTKQETSPSHAPISRGDQPIDLDSIRFMGASSTSIHGRLMYLFVTATITVAVLSFMSVFITPTLEEMFKAFGMDTSRFLWQMTITPAVLLYMLIAALILAFLVLSRSSVLGIGIPTWLPMMPGLARRKSELLHGLADAVDAGWPMGRALAVAHTISIDRVERRRLQQAMEWIEQGRSPAEAIRWAGWIEAKDVGWIDDAPASRLGTLLRAVGNRRVRDSVFNLGWIINLVFPILILALAAVVTLYCHGFLSGLFEMIRNLA
jgi:hypothetical protein